MIAPQQVRTQIDQTIATLRREEQDVATRLAALAEEIARHEAEEAETFRTLARLRLDQLHQGEVTERLDAAERAALGVLAAKRARLAEIKAEQKAMAGRRADAETARDAAEEALDAAEARLAALADATEAKLEGTQEWQALAETAHAARAVAEAADAKADRAEADRDQKAAAYRDDPLFLYLWERGYGTSDYRAMTLVRFFDGKVARLIGFHDARESYYRLHEIPRRLRAHAERQAEAAEAAATALAEHERAALEAEGADALEAEIEACEKAVLEAGAEVSRLGEEADALAREAAALLDPEGDPALAEALAGLARSMERAGLPRLAADAAATTGPEDDAAVARLETIAADRGRATREVAEARERQSSLTDRLHELEAERRRFRQKGYGAPGGGFDNGELIGHLLGGILAGAIRSGALGDALKGGYRRSRRGRSGFGGGIRVGSGGGIRVGRRSGGGGFRTGGGF